MKTLEINNHIIVFQDECGIQEDLVRTHGRCEKGRRLIGLKTATKHNKTGIIAGYTKLPNEKPETTKGKVFAVWVHACCELASN